MTSSIGSLPSDADFPERVGSSRSRFAPSIQGAGTGVGSWPGKDFAEACAVIRGELPTLPFVPELPARGPGSDCVGRAAVRLPGLPVELVPSGWQLSRHPGRDHHRGRARWQADADFVAELFDGWSGPLKVQLAGPWTLAASLWLPSGERALSDAGACRDIGQSFIEAALDVVAELRRAVPAAQPVFQLDEPSLGAVLAGEVPTASGYRRVAAIEPSTVQSGLSLCVAALRACQVPTVLHTCAVGLPLNVLSLSDVDALNLDVTQWGAREWEEAAPLVEGGLELWPGVLPSVDSPLRCQPLSRRQIVDDAVASLVRGWRVMGLPEKTLTHVVVTATCGFATSSSSWARMILGASSDVVQRLSERET
ncbi:MAG: methionine synthase [Actinomycetota bacterium]